MKKISKGNLFDSVRELNFQSPDSNKIMEVVAQINILFFENNFSLIEKDLCIITLKRLIDSELFEKIKNIN